MAHKYTIHKYTNGTFEPTGKGAQRISLACNLARQLFQETDVSILVKESDKILVRFNGKDTRVGE